MKRRLEYIIGQVLEANRRFEALRRSSAGEAEGEKLAVKDLVDSAAAHLSGLLTRAEAVVTVEVSPSLPSIRGHRKQLEIVMVNLLKNALEANAKRG